MTQLYDPDRHLEVVRSPWDASGLKQTLISMIFDHETAFKAKTLWPIHPLDFEYITDPKRRKKIPFTSLYVGAAGVFAGLEMLSKILQRPPNMDYAKSMERVWARHKKKPDAGSIHPSLLFGETGIRLVRYLVGRREDELDPLAALIESNINSKARELMWGSAGTMLAALAVYRKSQDSEFKRLYVKSAEALYESWKSDWKHGVYLWTQHLHEQRLCFLGAIHGQAGNLHAFLAGRDLLDEDFVEKIETRTIDLVKAFADRQYDQTNFRPQSARSDKMLLQWCHGAPGVITSLNEIRPGLDEEFDKIMIEAGDLIWEAGPLAKGSGLCHGTAGNGFAFLKLFDRTHDQMWLDRARAFAMHAKIQLHQSRKTHGRGRYSLFTGDIGAGVFIAQCINPDHRVPGVDRFC